MPQLVPVTKAVHASFLAAAQEFAAEDGTAAARRTTAVEALREYGSTWHTEDGFRAYLKRLAAAEDERTPWRAGLVACTTLWWVEGAEYLGQVAIRHRLTPFLLEQGGHIGYEIRPSARRKGHATAALRAAVPHMKALGIERALVTCDHDNTGSRKVIEACGGVLEDRRGRKLRYWISTS